MSEVNYRRWQIRKMGSVSIIDFKPRADAWAGYRPRASNYSMNPASCGQRMQKAAGKSPKDMRLRGLNQVD